MLDMFIHINLLFAVKPISLQRKKKDFPESLIEFLQDKITLCAKLDDMSKHRRLNIISKLSMIALYVLQTNYAKAGQLCLASDTNNGR